MKSSDNRPTNRDNRPISGLGSTGTMAIEARDSRNYTEHGTSIMTWTIGERSSIVSTGEGQIGTRLPQANPAWARLPLFDCRGWKRVRLGDVVKNVNETERAPAEAGIERFIGLEHLEPGSLHIRTWGNVAEGTTFTRRCRPGQVLFGKRRAYQRKVAVAEFDAVVSGDIYVLAPKNDRLLSELLPFLCLSEPFFQHAVGTSAGSLSPRTNWSSLASFEFDLPPLDQQRRIAEILWAVEAAKERATEVVATLERLRRSSVVHFCERGVSDGEFKMTPLGQRPAHWEVLPLRVHYDVQLGKKLYERERHGQNLRPYMRNANVQWNEIDLSEVDQMAFSAEEVEKYELRYGDILACEGRHVGKSAIWHNEVPGACFQMALHRIRAKIRDQEPEFLLHHMQYSSWRGLFNVGTGTTTIPHLPADRLKEIPFAFPPLVEQRKIVERVREIDSSLAVARCHSRVTHRLLQALVEQIAPPSD